MRTPEGRLVEPVHVPADVAERLAAEAERRGEPVGRVAGDLIAGVIADALAEAASYVVALATRSGVRGLPCPDAAAPPELPPTAPAETVTLHKVAPSLQPGDLPTGALGNAAPR